MQAQFVEITSSLLILECLINLIERDVREQNTTEFDDIGALSLSAKRELVNLSGLINAAGEFSQIEHRGVA